ncbi:tripartite tricarboxylate transporter substrate binding protein BugE [Piscinibacter sp.]|uniref:tripartite tricarboxylate transporter substrate binding protein BugE n=1 Tax=Piscinibacter sp. TaxID=1903157 RepID=UPI002F3E986A
MRIRTAIGLLLSLACGLAQAESYPAKPIRLVVPFAPGGATDIIARIVAEPLGKTLGQSVIVDNRGGAGGGIGMAEVAHSAGDGYTIGVATVSTHGVNPAITRKLAYDAEKDFKPVTALGTTPNVMAVHPSVPHKTHAEFVKYLGEHAGKVTYASPGIGSLGNMLGELYKSTTGTSMIHIPYRGAGPAKNDVVAGQVQVIFDNLPSSLGLIQAGQLSAVAVASPQRLASLPNVPTFGELKLDANNDPAWFGLVVPASTPDIMVTKIHAAVQTVLKRPDVRAQLAAQGVEPLGNTPEEFKAQISREIAKMKVVAKTAKIEIE